MRQNLNWNDEMVIRYPSGRISSFLNRCLPGLPETGRVHSIFRNSLNLLFGEQLMHIGREKDGLCCFGITVSDEAAEMLTGSVSKGGLAVRKKNGIEIFGREQVFFLTLEDCRVEDLRIPVMKSDEEISDPELDILKRETENRPLGIEDSPEFRENSRFLLQGTASQLYRAVGFFLGRGLGLTPAGDDILTGYGAALYFTGKEKKFLKVLDSSAPFRTTDISRAYLSAMEAGYANEPYICLLRAWAQHAGNAEEWMILVRNTGHTSGNDTLYGTWLALKKGKESV
jgi:hypothetical protein